MLTKTGISISFLQDVEKADLNITDFRPILEDRTLTQDFREHVQNEDFPTSLKEDLLRPTVESVIFENHSEKGTFDVPLKLQSKGTIKFIRILDTLYDLISDNHIYYLDELGEDLHYDLLFYYLNIFLYNSDQSQLLITSQETTLLSQDIIMIIVEWYGSWIKTRTPLLRNTVVETLMDYTRIFLFTILIELAD